MPPIVGASLPARAWRAYQAGGIRELFRRLRHRQRRLVSDASYRRWIEAYDRLTDEDRGRIREDIERLPRKPLISVLMPTYNTPELWLRKAVESVLSQLYPYLELCIADDASTDERTKRTLETYRTRDGRVKVVFRPENGHISAASNSALELATGEYIALLDHDDVLAEDALYHVAAAIARHDPDVIYTDNDKIDERERRYEPYFKPDWDPDLFCGQNFMSHLCVLRRSHVTEVGGFRLGFEGSQDYDLALRIVERTTPERIHHIAHVLYHWRAVPGSTAASWTEKPYAPSAARRAIEEHFQRTNRAAELTPTAQFWLVHQRIPEPAPNVTLIIPTRDNVDVLKQCVESITDRTTYPRYELLIVDNESRDTTYLTELERKGTARVIRFPGPFNFAAINNFAVSQVSGDLVGLLNDDLEVITPTWLAEMVGHACRPDVGAVGAMLYYPNETIQHAGVVLWGPGIAVHPYRHRRRGFAGQKGRAWLCQGLSAVTAACIVMRRSVYDQVGGMDEDNFAVAYNDVDFCLRIRALGYRIVWTPAAELYHRESVSRGSDAESERFKMEAALMQERWGDSLMEDPAYNPNLTLHGQPYTLGFPPRYLRRNR